MATRTLAAVLVPVFRDSEGELRLVLVVRGAGGVHGGQLALPGGKHEPSDRSLLETALREAEEEIGLSPAEVEVVSELEPLDSRTSGFRVHPFLARVHPCQRWRAARGEISEVVTPRVRTFVQHEARREELISFPTWPRPRYVECVVLERDHRVWGLTLRLLDALVPRLLADEWQI